MVQEQTAPLDLDTLSAALAKATPGPWENATEDGYWITAQNGDAELYEICRWWDPELQEEAEANNTLVVMLHNAAPQMIAEITALREEQGRAMQAFGESLLADVADALDEANAPGLATATRQLAKQKVAASIAALNLEGAAS